MSFIDRFETQLRQASADLQPLVPARSPRWRRRGSLVPLLAVAITGPAAAIVRPWSPELGRDGDVRSSAVPVAQEAKDAFAVLRRPQTARDRAAAGPLLRRIDKPLDQVQVADVRRIGRGWAVVPVQAFDTAPGFEDRGGAQICVTGRGTTGCSPVSAAAANGVTVLSAGADDTRYQGLVPDGVAFARFASTATGRTYKAAVHRNFLRLTIPEIGPMRMVRPMLPDGTRSRKAIRSPSSPAAGRFEWLNAAGAVVGPP